MSTQKTALETTSHLAYTIKKSKRSKHFRLTILCNGSIELTLPAKASRVRAELFFKNQEIWIREQLVHIHDKPCQSALSTPTPNYRLHREAAREAVAKRLAFFNMFYGFTFNRVRIKNQRTMWGSCSRNGNLNFNYKLALLPSNVADYVVVHELCHLKEFNHSKKFWELVAQKIPDYATCRQSLKSCDLLL